MDLTEFDDLAQVEVGSAATGRRNPLASALSSGQRTEATDGSDPSSGGGHDAAAAMLCGVPLEKGDAVVGRGQRGIPVAEVSTRDDAFQRGWLLRYANPAVEHDYVAFANRSRAVLLVLLARDVLPSIVVAVSGAPFSRQWVPLAIFNAVALLCHAVLTDAFVAFLYSRYGVRHPLSRTRRARLYELLLAVWVLRYGIETMLTNLTPAATFCPGEPFTHKQGPFPNQNDFGAGKSYCIAPGLGDVGGTLTLVLLLSGRLSVLGVAVTLSTAAIIVFNAVNVLQLPLPAFYNVSSAEHAQRVVTPIVVLVACLLCIAAIERRVRAHFEAVAAAARAVAARKAALRYGRALVLAVQHPNSGSGSAGTYRDNATTAQLRHDPQRDSVDPWCCTVMAARLRRLHTPGDFEAHYDTIQSLLTLMDAPLSLRVLVMGDELTVISAPCDLAACVLLHEPEHVAGGDCATNGGQAGCGDVDIDAALEANATTVCDAAKRLIDAVPRASALQPEWRRCYEGLAVAVTTGEVWQPRHGDDVRVELLSPAVSAARRMLDAPYASAGVVIVATPTAALVADSYTMAAMYVGRDGVSVGVLGDAVVSESGGAVSDVSNVTTLNSIAALADAVQPQSGDGDYDEARLDAELTIAAGCDGWCNNVVTRAFLPRFADPEVEAAFLAHDSTSTRPMYFAVVTVCIVSTMALAVLVVIDSPTGVDRWAPVWAVLVATLVMVSLFAVPVASTLSAVSRCAAVVVCIAGVCFPAFYAAARGHLEARDGGFVLVGVALVATLTIYPEQHVPRYLLLAAVVTTAAFVHFNAPPGRGQSWRIVTHGALAFIGTALLVVWSRANRAHYADARYTELMQQELADAQSDVAACLADHLPAVCVAALRIRPDEPICRPFTIDAATVVAVELNHQLIASDARWNVPSAPESQHTASSDEPRSSRANASDAPSSALAVANAHTALVRRFRKAGATTTVAGDAVVALFLSASADSATSMVATSSEAVLRALLDVVGPQRGAPSVVRLPVYPVAQFPQASFVAVRAGMHRADLVVGLCGARKCSFAAHGPALEGALRLMRTSIALGHVVVSSEADWLPSTHTVRGIGNVVARAVTSASDFVPRTPSTTGS